MPLDNDVTHREGPRFFTAHALGERLFFGAIAGDDTALWVSDGTAEGTLPLGKSDRDVGSDRYYLTGLGKRMLFFADDGSDAPGVFLSDATPEGTALLHYVKRDLADDVAFLPLNTERTSAPVALNEAIFWVEGTSTWGEQETPWMSDGTHGNELWTALVTP